MKNTFLTLLTVTLTINSLFAQHTNRQMVYFEYDQADLDPGSKSKLDHIIEKAKQKEVAQIIIVGHTDSDGSDEYNDVLSRKRALAVFDYFIANKVDKDKVKIDHYGEQQAAASNDNDPGKQQNRRVEIIIEYKAPIISDIFSKYDKEAQRFTFRANEEIDLLGKEGTRIRIPVNSLVKNNGGEITGEVEIILKEYYSKSDIVLANLHSTSNKELLETAGMIYVEAKMGSTGLKLRDGAEMSIEFSSANGLTDMEIFLGEPHGDQINWVQQGSESKVISEERLIAFVDGVGYWDLDSADIAKRSLVDDLVFKATDLGWINCDRFYKFDDKTDLVVQVDTNVKPVLRLVFKDINAIMPGHYSKDQKVIFNGIPVGQRVNLIGMSVVNDVPYFASKDFRISKNQEENIELVQTTLTEIEQRLKRFNSEIKH